MSNNPKTADEMNAWLSAEMAMLMEYLIKARKADPALACLLLVHTIVHIWKTETNIDSRNLPDLLHYFEQAWNNHGSYEPDHDVN